MTWWTETSVEGGCVFALDFRSISKSSVVYFSNEPNFTASIYPSSQSVYTSRTAGYDFSSLLSDQKVVKSYASFNIRDAHLRLGTHTLPTEFTIIIKAKVLDDTSFMSSSGSYHGLLYGTTGNNTSDFKWRFHGYTSEIDLSMYPKELLRETIHTVILKGNLDTKEVKMITDNGEELIPLSSFSSSNFLYPGRTYNTLGHLYNSASWRPTTDIIAYGLFSFEMSEEDITKTLAAIEKETFLSSEEDDQGFKFKTKFGTLLQSDENLTQDTINKEFFKVANSIRPGTFFTINRNLKNDQIPSLYAEYETISDHVLEEGLPIKTKLYLYEKGTGQLVKTTYSDLNGYFEFNLLNKDDEYIVRASDKKYQFQSINKDYNN